MSSDDIRLTTRGPVATLLLNRPGKRNALTEAMLHDMIAAIDAVEREGGARVLVVRGSGDSFCAGHDLREMLEHRERGNAVDHGLLQELFRRLDSHVNPTIAAVQGVALAGGCELALHCDVRIATPTARFGMPLARVGLVVPFVLAQRLVRIAGPSAAADMLLTGDTVDGERAVRLGIATRLASNETLDADVDATADRIAANAPLAVREMKRILRQIAAATVIADTGQFEDARRRISEGDDVREGLRAFAERRTPQFAGA